MFKPYRKMKILNQHFITKVYNLQSFENGKIAIKGIFIDDIDYDELLANELKMPVDQYRQLMIENFNAKLIKPNPITRYFISQPQISQLYFKDYKDAKNAAEFLEPVLVMNKLINN